MFRKWATALLFIALPSIAQTESSHVHETDADSALQLGDYGYRHKENHAIGAIVALRKKTNTRCCDDEGECRASQVDMRARKAFLNRRWCDIPNHIQIHTGIELAGDDQALVCAGKFPSNTNTGCPTIWCITIREQY